MADPAISPPEPAPAAPLEQSRRQLEALLEVAESIAQHRDLNALFHDLAERLHCVVDFDFLTLVLHDPVRNVMRLHILETRLPTPAKTGSETPVDGHPSGWVWQSQLPFVVSDTEEDHRFPDFLQRLRDIGVRSLAMVPLTTAQRRLGAMGFGRLVPQGITDTELQFMQRVGSQVAVAVDNALNYQTSQAYQIQLARERDRLQVLLEVNNVLVSSRELPDLFRGIVTSLEKVIHHDYTSLALRESSSGLLKIHALDFSSRPGLFDQEITVPLDTTPSGHCFTTGQPLLARGSEIDRFSNEIIRMLRAEGVQTICCVPLITHSRTFGTLNLASRREDAFPPQDVELLQQVAAQIAIAVENALAFKQIDALKDKLAEEKLYLEEEIRSEFNFEEIIGESPAIKRALAQVELVAPAGTAVLVTGETGTGKELIARAVHNHSPRRERTFVKINCAAIPGGLLESELFGHERGAFTGALTQKIGRFELADHGTLFLDEVADLPIDLQPKLLRVLQEQEFERLGSNHTRRVDVRIVAATNADLAKLVAERSFRSDLYYRLNVFPIHIPALRERREDVPHLVRYFVQKFSRRLNKTVAYIPSDAMDALSNYSWPGNIRELENFIERAVLLSPGKELRVPLAELHSTAFANHGENSPAGADSSSSFATLTAPASSISTLEEAERQHILRALRQTGWRIAGPKGAAALLGMKRTTLQARMRKLAIRRPV
ncbi:MAG TPA: sigma 54-interacting transcriptional regulator [Candidatus Acidoferrum sp.]|jgi:formate hydrogenlyase transcriptional activator|nr:sigma 54-interacting transcriptional regulator [Candidatus Acidoferrum sp.]